MSSKHLLSGIEETLGPELLKKIQSSKILLVGAGGIGCELLKNLALTGFRTIEVIDLDTIDVSNLNRQLLFRSQHVGMPKCTVAAQVATGLAGDPSVLQYTAHHGNVCDNAYFNVPFVQKFDLVLNALDNVVARRRVNRLCLAAAVPLVEAGTTGYLGQVNVIHKQSGTACYECQTQEQQKVYPICTIRSTPSMPVHTIVWAKELYKLLFGEKADESMLYEDPAGEEPSTYMQAVLEFRQLLEQAKNESTTVGNENIQSAAKELITKLYVTEIQKQLDMDRYKTARKTPVVLAAHTIEGGMDGTTAPTQSETYNQNDLWTAAQCVAEWASCLQEAVADPAVVLPTFDKDDSLSMRFVTAASNLRSMVFGIEPTQSYYSAKGIAGNIIPAIATTNAICAGLQILQAFSILQAQIEGKGDELKEHCSYINCLRNKTRNGLYLSATKLENPNSKCFVCKSAILPLALNTKEWTLQDFLDKVIKKDLGFEEPTLMLDGGDVIWEEGQNADSESFAPNLTKQLPALPCGGIQHGSILTIEDFSQDLTVELNVSHQDVWEKGEEADEDETHKFIIGGQKPVAVADKLTANGDAKPSASKTNEDGGDDVDDVIEVLETTKDNVDKKRPAEKSVEAPPAKKSKPSEDVEVIEID